MKKHPTFGPQAEIDGKAQLILKEQLEPNWTVRDRLPDIRIDYEIEQKAAGEPTALTAYVQLKGQRRSDVRGARVRIRLKSKDLAYWRDAKRPVILIVTDVSGKKSRFLFIQEWLAVNLPPAELERKSTHKIDVPLENDLEDQGLFIAEIRKADRFMSDLFSTSPEKAIAATERELAKLDSRFEVSLTATRQGRSYRIEPTGPEPVALNMTLPLLTPDHKAVASDVFKWGKPGTLLVNNAKIEGSPLFEHLMSRAHLLELRLDGNTRPAEIVLTAGGKDRRAHVVAGMLSYGPAGLAFTSSDAAAIRVRVTMPVEGSEKGVGHINYFADATIWKGQQLLSIPGLRDLARFTAACVKAKAMSAELRVGAISMPFRRRSIDTAEFFDTLSWWATLLADAAEAALVLGINPVVPDLTTLTQDVLDKTEVAINLARKRAIELPSLVFHADETVWAQVSGDVAELTGWVVKAEHRGKVSLLGLVHPVNLVLADVGGRVVRLGEKSDPERRIRVFPTDRPEFRFELRGE